MLRIQTDYITLITTCPHFGGILTVGKVNVKIEFLLLSIGYNINKLHAKIKKISFRAT